MTIMWYQYNLIFITLLIFIIHLLFKEDLIFFILINFEIIGFFLQYSDYNFNCFSKYEYNKKYTFGRFVEIIPYCITGYFMASINLINNLSKYRFISINIILSILIIIDKYIIFIQTKGFGYQGLKLYISSISIILSFSLVPNEAFINKHVIRFFEIISIQTPGIYFIHKILFNYLHIFSFFKDMVLSDAIVIYFISYFISLIGSFIFKKTELIYLFN